MPSKRTAKSSIDVAVIGGGAMGTSTAYQLARRGVDVHLFEQYVIGHDLGSSHGHSRIIRRAYFEHPDYVPLVERSYELWRQIEKESGESLLTITGIVEMGAPDSELIRGCLQSCEQYNIPHERLTAAQINKRFPQFTIPGSMEGIWQKDAGILAVERCILTQRLLARKRGATLHEEEEVLSLTPPKSRSGSGGKITIETRKGTYTCRKAVVCAGPWANRILADLKLPLEVERQTLGFYTPLDRAAFELGTFPLFLMETPQGSYYGFPFFGVDCMKIAQHHGGIVVKPESVDRNFTPADDKNLRDILKNYIPKAAGPMRFGKVCLYTNTPDSDFILDAHPTSNDIYIAAGFSGHGFKFASVVGEVMADFVQHGKTRHSIGRFKISRFLKK